MKKNLFVVAAASCICFYANAFNSRKLSRPVVTAKMEQTLTEEFGNYETVQWKYTFDDKVEADLKVGGQDVQAFFSDEHEYLCSTIVMSKENLPLKLQLAINKTLPDIKITSVVQVISTAGTTYYFKGAIGNNIKVWNGTADGEIEVYQKIKGV